MSKTAKDYPVTFPYGATTPPYSRSHPHLGEDRAMPSGTPIPVNGVVIGFSGNTGFSTGAHLHIQKVVNGQVVNPHGTGFTLKTPVKVIEVGERKDIGKYIRLQNGSGQVYSYFHLSKIMVKKGQTLKKEDDMSHKGKSAEYWYKKYIAADKKAKHYRDRTLEEKKKVTVLEKIKQLLKGGK